MPSIEVEHPPRRTRSKAPPAGLSADTLYLGEKLEAVEDRIARLEAKAPSPQMLIGAAVMLVTMVFAGQVYMVSLIATSRGVDVAPAAGATRTIVETASGSVSVETKKTEPTPSDAPEP